MKVICPHCKEERMVEIVGERNGVTLYYCNNCSKTFPIKLEK